MAHAQFLRLLQAVEAQRRCEGKDCLAITEDIVAFAERTDIERNTHALSECDVEGLASACVRCAEIGRKEIALRETLHSQGVDFPVGLLTFAND